jgi:serine/threonine protein kinase
MVSRNLDVGAVIDGRYRLCERIGSVAQGEAFVAEDDDGARFRLLVVSTASADEIEQDVISASRLSSPYVIPIVGHGVDGASGARYFVMPAVQGETLESMLARLGPLDTQAVARVGIQLARAVDEAHSKGISLGAIRPIDVVLERKTNDIAVARLACSCMFQRDLARLWHGVQDNQTATSPAATTRSGRVHGDAASDILALGTVLYAALTGTWPDPASDKDIPWLQSVAPWVEGGLAKVVQATLLRDAENRCPSAHALIGALARHASGDPDLPWQMLGVSEMRRASAAPPVEPPASWLDISLPSHAEDEQADRLLGATLDGRYQLVGQVGSGGMGVVYEALDPSGKPCAIKVIKRDMLLHGGDTVRRFVREARATRAIESEHVVRVIEAGTDADRGLPYIVMEMLRGTDLATFLSTQGAMDPGCAAWVFWRACLGLGRAHELGMVHRDVKPANIFLHETDEGVIPKLCDFGVAKMDASLREHSATALTQTGGILGSPLYMAPEHAENAKRADARSDVWSLGISLYETLAGARPWEDCSTIGELLLALYTKEVVPLQNRAPWVSPELAAVVHTALQREASARFANASEMAAALEPLASELGPRGPAKLQRVSPEIRSLSAPKLDVGAISGASPVTSPPGPTSSSRPTTFVIVGAIVLVTAGFGAFLAARATAPEAPAASASAPSADSVAPPKRTEAFVRITPASASVSVDGAATALDNGTLTLLRGPGETAHVVVEAEGVRQETSVVITADGRAIPSEITLAPPAASASAAGPVVSKSPPRTGAAKPTAMEPANTGVPTPAATPSTPKFNKDWQ